jgi:hypothetical protein
MGWSAIEEEEEWVLLNGMKILFIPFLHIYVISKCRLWSLSQYE